jgi:hypothetical protein
VCICIYIYFFPKVNYSSMKLGKNRGQEWYR